MVTATAILSRDNRHKDLHFLNITASNGAANFERQIYRLR